MRDSTRMYDLTKQYHEVRNELLDHERDLLLELPRDDELFDRGKEALLGAWLSAQIDERWPDLLPRVREVVAELLDAMKAEQGATVAAGWAADYGMKERIGA
jgi:hypothetical protein